MQRKLLAVFSDVMAEHEDADETIVSITADKAASTANETFQQLQQCRRPLNQLGQMLIDKQ